MYHLNPHLPVTSCYFSPSLTNSPIPPWLLLSVSKLSFKQLATLKVKTAGFFKTRDTLPHPQCSHLKSRIIIILEPRWWPYINSVYNCSLYIELKICFCKVLNRKLVILLLDMSKNEHNGGEHVHVINKRVDQVGTQLFLFALHFTE